jgi:hypothetical protein
MATLLITDADFLAAEREIAEVRAERQALSPSIKTVGDKQSKTVGDEQRLDKPLSDRMWALYDQITLSPPVSLASAAIKLRLLADPDLGLENNEGVNDVDSLRQALGLVERVASDDAILTLFRQWIEAHLVAAQIGEATGDSPEFDAAMDRVNDLEREIPKIQAQGSVGLAIKAYLAAHYEHGPALGDHPAGSRIDPAWLGALNADNLVSLVRDAARFVPEIAALAAPLIGEARS